MFHLCLVFPVIRRVRAWLYWDFDRTLCHIIIRLLPAENSKLLESNLRMAQVESLFSEMHMSKTIEIKEAKARYALPLDEVSLAEEPLIVEREGKPVAAIIPFVEYKKYKAWQEQEGQAATRQAQLQKFEREKEAYLHLKPQLLQTHRGHFVAIHEGKVVDTDQDKRELVRRVVERYGNKPIYIQLVAEELRSFEIPSPETEPRA